MTGKELIIHILENNLENEPIFEDGKLAGFMSVSEVAEQLNVGAATVLTWLNLGYLNCIVLGDVIHIPFNSKITEMEVNAIE